MDWYLSATISLALILHKNAYTLSAKGSFNQTVFFSFNFGPWQGWGENSNAYVTRYLHRACERYSIATVAPAPLARSGAAMLICATPPVHYLSAGRGSLRTVSLNAMSLPVMERCPYLWRLMRKQKGGCRALTRAYVLKERWRGGRSPGRTARKTELALNCWGELYWLWLLRERAVSVCARRCLSLDWGQAEQTCRAQGEKARAERYG